MAPERFRLTAVVPVEWMTSCARWRSAGAAVESNGAPAAWMRSELWHVEKPRSQRELNWHNIQGGEGVFCKRRGAQALAAL